MARDELDGQIEGQMTITDLYEPPERLLAVSRIFARARKEMSLAEQKTFVYALSELKFTDEPEKEYVLLDKKILANILGLDGTASHLSRDIFRAVKDLWKHSGIEITKEDREFYDSGAVVINVRSTRNYVRVTFNKEYLPLFTNLSRDYITLWSSDIFGMNSKRSVQFYEYLRQITDTRVSANNIALGVKALKEKFEIPQSGKGSYMRKDGHFDRPSFERYVIDPLCEDLSKCKMIRLIMQPDGKYYEKVRQGKRVLGYRFYWTYTSHPAVADAGTVKQIQERVDNNPQILKVAKDIIAGEKPKRSRQKYDPQKSRFNDYDTKRDYTTGADKDTMDALMQKLRHPSQPE